MRKLFLTSMAAAAVICAAQVQARTTNGIVVDAGTGEEIIGATVMPIGGGQGTATDLDGKFTLNVPDNVKTARVSAVGYKEQIVNLTPNMRIQLESTATNIDEVVVIGYGTATKESLTGSVAVVGSKEIEDRPVTSVTQALEGNAPGVQVNSTTGAPGSSPAIRIRGIGTVTGYSEPQYVVDGVIFNGDLADLNPADIESMTVLKDAASCAIYGVRGSNGVVLITTKKAKNKGHAEVTLTVREGMYTRGLPNYDRLGANEWMEAMFQSKVNELMVLNPGNYPDRATASAYLKENMIGGYLQGHNIYNAPNNEVYDENGKVVASVLPGYTDLDWWDAVSRTGLRQEYNLNMVAAADKYNLFASVSYLNEKGYMLKTDFERFNGRFNVNFEPTSYLRTGVNMNASYQTSQANNGAGSNWVVNPFATQFYAPIFPYYAHNEDGSIIYGEDGKPQWNLRGMLDNRNVAYELRLNNTESTGLTVDANAYATAVLPYGFDVTIRGNMSRTNVHGYNYQNNIIGDAYPLGRLTDSNAQYRSHTFMQNINWHHSYGDDMHLHTLDVVLGHENTTSYSATQSVMMTNQIADGYYAISNFTEAQDTPTGSYGEGRSESYLGRARYNYNDIYFLEASLRRDGSDRFGKDNRWGTFWSVGGSWIISKEKFMHELTWINYLKLRVSYGSVGNYLSAPGLSWASQYVWMNRSNTPMLVRWTTGNSDLQWESQKTLDIGLEGTVFDNRLNFSIGYFDKTSSDLIFDVPIAPSQGNQMFTAETMTVPRNIGQLANRGWELSFNGTIMRNQDLQWTASLDMTFLKNKFLKLPYDNKDMANGSQRLSVGHSRYDWFTYHYAGVDQMTGKPLYTFDEAEYKYVYKDNYNEEDLQKHWEQNVADAKANNALVEINGKTYTTSQAYATRSWRGNALPTVYGSFGTQLSYKNINFGILFTYSLGGKVMDSYYQSLMCIGSSITSAYHKDVLKAWTEVPAGMTADSPNRIDKNGVPRTDPTDNNINIPSDRWLTSASWLVLKNINISYTLPARWTNAIQLSSVNVGFSVDNLFTVAGRKGLNPQMTWSGVQGDTSAAGYMTNRVFSFQLTARF